MAGSVLINLENLQEDTEFPARLAQQARLAYNAGVESKGEFKDPFTDEVKKVITLEAYDYNTRQYVKVPGVRVAHNGLYWECHYAGLTKNSREFFKFRGSHPHILQKDQAGGIIPKATTIVTGQIFANKKDKDTEYNMQMRNIADSTLLKSAQDLYAAGVPLHTILAAMPTVAESDITGDGKARARSSDVQLG